MTKHQLNSAQAATLIHYLFSYTMTNYGYDVTSWSRIIAQRSRAKAQVSTLLLKDKEELMANINNEWMTNSRLSIVNGKFNYTVGQSANEEITNIIRRLANPSAKWAM